jgi:uncharacterized membrane protein HdeD (DUF308 family)
MSGIAHMSDADATAIRTQISESSGWFIAVGVLLVLLGMAAVALPLFSTIAAAVWIGWTLLFSGVLMLFHALFTWRWPDSVWSILVAALYLWTGGLILYAPLASVLSLTFIMAALFVAEGVFETVQAFRLRPLAGWGWMLFSGVCAIVLGALIGYSFPGSAAWVLGLFFGLNLLSTGLSFVFLALACREGAQKVQGFGRPDLKPS